MRIDQSHENRCCEADEREETDDDVAAQPVDNQAHEQTHDYPRDDAGAISETGLEGREPLDALEEEVGDLLKGVEGAPDEEDVDADGCEDAVAPEAVGDQSRSAGSLLSLDP